MYTAAHTRAHHRRRHRAAARHRCRPRPRHCRVEPRAADAAHAHAIATSSRERAPAAEPRRAAKARRPQSRVVAPAARKHSHLLVHVLTRRGRVREANAVKAYDREGARACGAAQSQPRPQTVGRCDDRRTFPSKFHARQAAHIVIGLVRSARGLHRPNCASRPNARDPRGASVEK